MKIVSADITGSLIVNGVDVTTNVVSSSIFSGSIAGRVASLEQFSSSLDATFATDASVTASILVLSQSVQNSQAALSSSYTLTSGSYVITSGSYVITSGSYAASSASLSTRVTTNETNITTLTNASASFAVVSSSFSSTSGSLSTRVTNLEATSSTVSSSFASTSGSIAGRVTLIEGQYATTGSNNFTGPQFINQASNAISFTSTASLYTDGGLRVAKDSFVSGTAYFNNITVYGTSSIEYITSSQIDIGSNVITVNTDTPAIRFGGISVFDSGSTQLTGSLFWDSEKNHWIYSNPSGSSYNSAMLMNGPRNTGSLGTEQGTTNNALMKGQGGDHITSSQMIDDGTTVQIPGNLQVTGSLVNTGVATFGSSIQATNIGINYAPQGAGSLSIYKNTGAFINLYDDAFYCSIKTTVTGGTQSNLVFGTQGGTTALTLGYNQAATFSSDITARSGTIDSRVFKIYEASAARGGLYPYNLVLGSGTDYSVGIFSEGEIFMASGGTATKRLTIASTGAATFTAATQDAIQTVVRMSGNNASGQLKALDFKLTAGTPLWTISTAAVGTDVGINIMPNGSAGLSLATTGAATFSSSVQAASLSINTAPLSDRMLYISANLPTTGASQFQSVINGTVVNAATTIYGMYVGNNSNVNVTNSYAIYLETTGGSGTITNKYGIYQSSSGDKNYFAGNIGIGTSSPSYKLDVSGTTRIVASSQALTIDGGTGALDRGVITTHVDRLEQLALVRAGVGTFGIHITTGGVAILSGQDTSTNMLSMVLATGAATFSSTVTALTYNRAAAGTGYLNGKYASVENTNTTGPIYCIGDSYVPTSTTTNTMYGVGYSYNSFTGAFGPANTWSFYVVGGGTVGVTLGADGNGYFRADVIAYYSDRRLKTNIRVIDNAIDKVKKLGGYYYNPNDLAVELKATDDQDERVGVMAQEVMEVLPHAVKDAPFDRTGTYKTVQYEKLVPLLIQAIKEQQTQIEELKTLIHGLTK
jgi:hypothetical protein